MCYRIVTLSFLLSCLPLGAQITGPVTNHLRACWRADVGVVTANITPRWSSATVGVTNWQDCSAAYLGGTTTNLFTQFSSNSFPPYVTDKQGYNCLEFPWAFPPVGGTYFVPTNWMTCSNISIASSQNITIFVVARDTTQRQAQSVVWAPSWGFSLMAGARVSFTAFAISTNWMPCNKSVVMVSNASSNSVSGVNYHRQVMSSVGNTSLTGLEIGGFIPNTLFAGDLYAILVYDGTLTSSQWDTNVVWAAGTFNVPTNYTKLASCGGDSKTEGVGTTNLLNWVTDCADQYPEVEWFNFALGGARLGTNGSASGFIFTDALTFTDLTLNPATTNIHIFEAGYNDLTAGGLSADAVYGEITNYCRARTAAGWISDYPTSLPDASGQTASITTLNTDLRRPPLFYPDIVDSGLNSPTETRLNSSANTVYFYSDALHLVNAGHLVREEKAAFLISQPHRSTGFFSQ